MGGAASVGGNLDKAMVACGYPPLNESAATKQQVAPHCQPVVGGATLVQGGYSQALVFSDVVKRSMS